MRFKIHFLVGINICKNFIVPSLNYKSIGNNLNVTAFLNFNRFMKNPKKLLFCINLKLSPIDLELNFVIKNFYRSRFRLKMDLKSYFKGRKILA